MRLRSLLRTYSFQTTLRYAAVFGLAMGGLFIVIYWLTTSFMTEELKEQVSADMAPLLEHYETSGVSGIADLISQRAHASGISTRFYMLQDRAGRKMAGNLAAMEPFTGWLRLRIPVELGGEDDSDQLLAEGRMLPDGSFLLVGEDMDQFYDVQEWITEVAGWGVLAAFCLALMGGLATSASILRRIQAIADTSGEIVQGNLAHRIATRGTGDEFDQLSGNLNTMLDRIQGLMEGLSQMSNDIAHDLRTPLTRLRQHLETAQSKARTTAEFSEIVDKAIKETDDILQTFSALLRIAQIEAGTRRSAFTEVDLSAVVCTIVEAYTAVAEDARHSLKHDIAPGVVVRGDRQLLTQMLANLVENALRHTPVGTSVDITLGGDRAAPVCTITDDGPGIPEGERAKVFRRFYRMDRSRSTAGSGLGLSLVAAVAELHRIAIEIGDQHPGLKVILRLHGVDQAAPAQ